MIKIGQKVRIINMNGEPQYAGKEGYITEINPDPWGDTQIHGTWGGCCLYLGMDEFEVIEDVRDEDNIL